MKRIAYITDIHLEEDFPLKHGVHSFDNWKLILDDVRKRAIDEIIFGGDIGEITAYPAFFESLKDFKLNITPGNHDQSTAILKHHRPAGAKLTDSIYSAYEEETFKYLFMDSSKEEISEEQFQWLTDELATDKKLLLFMHHPILAIDTPVDDLYPLRGREKLVQQLLNAKTEIILFCGHYHMMDRRTYNNITQFVTPAASFQIIKEAPSLEIDSSTFGYRIISIDQQVDSAILLYRDGAFIPHK